MVRRRCSLGAVVSLVVAICLVVQVGMFTMSASAATVAPVPAKFVGGCLESWSSLVPGDLPADYNFLFYTFATINADGSIGWDITQDEAKLKASIASFAAAGKPTILSVGGAGGAESGMQTAAQQRNFLTSVEKVIDQYGFSGIEWDIEAEQPMSATGMAAVSRELVARYGPQFAIVLAPYGDPEVEAVYQDLARQIKNILTLVAFQYYNDDKPPTSAWVLSELETWMRLTGVTPAQWTLGFMQRDDQGNTTSYALMAELWKAAVARYPTIRGVWTWEISDDRANGWQFSRTLAPAVAAAPVTPPVPAPAPPPVPPPAPSPAPVVVGWEQLRQCESDNNYQSNDGDGYYGAYQFTLESWRAVGGTGLPSEASPAVQDALALKAYQMWGPGAWPTCGRFLHKGSTTPPAPPSGTYRVVAGDTFAKIAAKLGIAKAALRAANPGVNGRSLYPGRVLRLPARG